MLYSLWTQILKEQIVNNREIVQTKDMEGNDFSLAILRPTPEQEFNAQLKYNAVLRVALEGKSLLRQSLDKYMREQNLWDDEKQKQVEELSQNILDEETKLMKGGIKKSEARNVCIKLRLLRRALQEMFQIRNSLDAATADALADNARFDYLVSQCVVYNDTGKHFFESLEDYRNRGDERAAVESATKFAAMYHGIDSDFLMKLPENKVLKQLGMMNDKMHLINDKGQLVDVLNRRIDDDGNLLNEDGQKVDDKGNLLDDNDNLLVEPVFLDDDVPEVKKV